MRTFLMCPMNNHRLVCCCRQHWQASRLHTVLLGGVAGVPGCASCSKCNIRSVKQISGEIISCCSLSLGVYRPVYAGHAVRIICMYAVSEVVHDELRACVVCDCLCACQERLQGRHETLRASALLLVCCTHELLSSLCAATDKPWQYLLKFVKSDQVAV